jgi:hypothetical protein
MRRISPIALLLCSLCALPATADTIDVDVNGTGDFLTIQEGLDAAAPGETVLVYAGTYSGPGNRWLVFGGKDIVLASVAGQSETIIDLHAGGFGFMSGESPLAVVDGFTVANGFAYNGGGLLCDGSSPTIRNCRFTYCLAEGDMHIEGWGGAGYLWNSDTLIEDCSFEHNLACCCGGALVINNYSNVTLRNCIFVDNEDDFQGSGAIDIRGGSTATIEGCTFLENSVGAVSILAPARSHIRDCTFVGNGAAWRPVIQLFPPGAGGSEVLRSVFAFNNSESSIDCDSPGPIISHCCFYESGADSLCAGASPELNLFEDPLLCGLAESDYTLCANSPCLPANNEWTESIGAYDEGCPPCNSPVESVTWGVIKALYR